MRILAQREPRQTFRRLPHGEISIAHRVGEGGVALPQGRLHQHGYLPETTAPAHALGIVEPSPPHEHGGRSAPAAVIGRGEAVPARDFPPGIALGPVNEMRAGLEEARPAIGHAQRAVGMDAPANPVGRFDHQHAAAHIDRLAGCRQPRRPRANHEKIDLAARQRLRERLPAVKRARTGGARTGGARTGGGKTGGGKTPRQQPPARQGDGGMDSDHAPS